MFQMNNFFNFRFQWKIKQKLTWNNIIMQNLQKSHLCKLNDIQYVQKVKVKVKFTLEQATKAQKGSRGIALLFP
jgi:hypothetical protein